MADGMNKMGWPVEKPRAAMYLWAKIPQRYAKDEFAGFRHDVFEGSRGGVSPGSGFGKLGRGLRPHGPGGEQGPDPPGFGNMKKLFS